MSDKDISAPFVLIGELGTAMFNAIAEKRRQFVEGVTDAFAKQAANRDTP